MSIGVQRNTDIRISHQFLQILVIRSAGDHIGTIRMPEAMHMKRDMRQMILNQFVAVLQGLRRNQFPVFFSADKIKRQKILPYLRPL